MSEKRRTVHGLRELEKARWFFVGAVEDISDVASELEVLLLIIADGNMCRPARSS